MPHSLPARVIAELARRTESESPVIQVTSSEAYFPLHASGS